MNKIVILFFSLLMLQIANAAETSPVGYWQTIDDVTGKPKAIIQIWENADNVLFGKVLKIYPRPGVSQNEVCTACEGSKHNQPIIGMVILEQLKPNKENTSEWIDGQILDPKNGKVYHSTIRLIESSQKLNVKGYIGLPTFGRTQTWVRTTDPTKG